MYVCFICILFEEMKITMKSIELILLEQTKLSKSLQKH